MTGAYAVQSQREIEDSVIFGRSGRMLALQAKLRTVANSNLPVLIEGESGTGKEVIARLVHEWSPVSSGPFVQISCPTMPAMIFESDLFGYDRPNGNGASGTDTRRPSLAKGGTLCLDEIGELDPTLQAKLLQFLQDGKFRPAPETPDGAVEVRLVCATGRDLEPAVLAGTFRRDLFYRINVVRLQLPPLRERAMDLPELCAHFIALYNRAFNCAAQSLSPSLMDRLQRYSWPGNIRQLANLMKRYVVLDSEDVVLQEIAGNSPAKASAQESLPNGSISLQRASREVRRSFEKQQILRALEANQWNRKRAARALNISYRALLYKLKECHFETPMTD